MPIVINKAAVRRSLEQWFIAARAGETLGARESAALSAHEAAALSSDYFYHLLCADEDTAIAVTHEPVPLIAAEDIAAGQLLVVDAEGKVTGFVGETTGDGTGEALPPIEAGATLGEPGEVLRAQHQEKASRKRTKPAEAAADDFFG